MRKRDHTMFCCWKKSLYGRREATQYTRIEREREAQRISLLTRMATVTTMNNQQQQQQQQPLLKVTRSLYIVTHLGQLPFMLFTQMARTWAIKEDSVNTSIIH